MLKLKSIEEERKNCIKAFEKAQTKVDDMVLHCHHGILCETLICPYINRINYITKIKNDNVALRLRLFRPFPFSKDKNLSKARKDYYKACKDFNIVHKDYYNACKDYRTRKDFYIVHKDYYKAYEALYKTRKDLCKACHDYYTTHKPKNDPWNGETIFANGFELKF